MNPMNPIEIARNLFLLRTRRGMTVEELAAALDVAPERICEWECAKVSPSMDQMIRLAHLYGVKLDEIVRTPQPESEPTENAIPTEEPSPSTEPTAATNEEPPAPRRSRRRSREHPPKAWEIAVILLILMVIAAAVLFLLRPDLLPLPQISDTADFDRILPLLRVFPKGF